MESAYDDKIAARRSQPILVLTINFTIFFLAGCTKDVLFVLFAFRCAAAFRFLLLLLGLGAVAVESGATRVTVSVAVSNTTNRVSLTTTGIEGNDDTAPLVVVIVFSNPEFRSRCGSSIAGASGKIGVRLSTPQITASCRTLS